MNILIIEDEVYAANGLGMSLELRGHTVNICTNAEGYLVQESQGLRRFDAVILDLMIPRSASLEVPNTMETGEVIYERIIERVPTIGIIITSGKAKDDLKIDISGDNCIYLKKPSETKIDHIINALDQL